MHTHSVSTCVCTCKDPSTRVTHVLGAVYAQAHTDTHVHHTALHAHVSTHIITPCAATHAEYTHTQGHIHA